MFTAHRSVRARILAIALIPSVALLAIGVGAAGYLAAQGFKARDWATTIQKAQGIVFDFSKGVQEERRLTMAKLAGNSQVSAQLIAARQQTDTGVNGMLQAGADLNSIDPTTTQDSSQAFIALSQQLTALRQRVDAGVANLQDVYAFYNQLGVIVSIGTSAIAHNAPDAAISTEETTANTLYQATESMARANALGQAAVAAGGFTPDQLLEFSHEVGSYHGQLDYVLPNLTPQEQADYQTLAKSTGWQQVSSMENALLQRGAVPLAGRNVTPLPLGEEQWQNAANQVSTGLLDLWNSHNEYAQRYALDDGNAQARNFLLAGGGVLLVAIIAFLIALQLSNRVIGRLKRLRQETLTLADERLPDIMGRLRNGEQVDISTEVPPLDHGTDEIGQVAKAFNRAQSAAVTAAVTEAKTREGVNAVFLNIAHRSQVVVHRQLEILDKAEYEQEDPGQLDMLFQLDHLATRERRNAENLIILGGEQPGRRWRNPVLLVELVRSAVAETENYARVRTARLPDVSVVGNVVADLIHLLAELVDNATTFSPPESRVEISGNVVGKGVVVEISDQGLGMPAEELERVNATLRNPPDFTVTTLSSDSRLGVFVVAQLANRNGVSVKLAESDYGGIRAIVLIPSSLIADTPPSVEPALIPEPEDEVQHARRRAALPADDWPAPQAEAARPAPQPEPARPAPQVEPALAGVRNGAAAMSWPTEEPPGAFAATRMSPSADGRQAPPTPPTPSSPESSGPRHRGEERPPDRTRERMPERRAERPPSLDGRGPADDRPELPRRRRQTNLVPQLMKPPRGTPPENGNGGAPRPGAERARTAEQARDLLSAIETGTRQGRQRQYDNRIDEREEREGHGNFRHP